MVDGSAHPVEQPRQPVTPTRPSDLVALPGRRADEVLGDVEAGRKVKSRDDGVRHVGRESTAAQVVGQRQAAGHLDAELLVREPGEVAVTTVQGQHGRACVSGVAAPTLNATACIIQDPEDNGAVAL